MLAAMFPRRRRSLLPFVTTAALTLCAAGCVNPSRPIATAVGAGLIAAVGSEVMFVTTRMPAPMPYPIPGAELRAIGASGGRPRSVYRAPKDTEICHLSASGDRAVVALIPALDRSPKPGRPPYQILSVTARGEAKVLVEPEGLLCLAGGPITGDDTHVYYAEARKGLFRVPTAGGDRELLAGDVSAQQLTTFGDTLFFATHRGEVFRLPKTGGKPVALGDLGLVPNCLAVDGERVYSGSSATSGTIASVAATRGGKPAHQKHAPGSCPLVAKRGIVFSRQGNAAHGYGSQERYGNLLEADLMNVGAQKRVQWIAVGAKGLYGTDSTGSIYFTPINWR